MSLVVDLFRRSAMRNALTLSGLFIVVLALCGIWMVSQIRSQVRDDIDERLLLYHQDLVNVTPDEMVQWFQGQDDPIMFSESYRTADGQVVGDLRPEIFDRNGFQTVSATDLFQPRLLNQFERISIELAEEFAEAETFGLEAWRVYVGPADIGQLAVFEPISGVEQALSLVPRAVMTVGVALVMTTLLSGAFMAWRQQARLDQVREGIARIGRGDLSHPMRPASVRDDLDEIMLGIDSAALELNNSITRLRLFSQNVAHELRTPLARLRAALEDSPGTPEAALERTDEVIRTLDAVQRIARLSHQPDPGTLSQVSLRDVVVLADELFAEVATEHSQRLEIETNAPATVNGDFQLLAQMLSNLVENAIRYAGPGASITIRADGPQLSVRDTGPGIGSEQDMTEPFARSAEARTGEGTGLGLALVKAIAHYHGAELKLESENGLFALITFPGIG